MTTNSGTPHSHDLREEKMSALELERIQKQKVQQSTAAQAGDDGYINEVYNRAGTYAT